MIEQFHKACQDVLDIKSDGYYMPYAKTYAKVGLTLTREDDVSMQVLYILSNLKGRSAQVCAVHNDLKQLHRSLV